MYLPWVVAEARSVTLPLATTQLEYLKVSDPRMSVCRNSFTDDGVSVDPDA